MDIWFCSDFHFGHENIIRYTKRPFKSLEEMDNLMINNFNKRVKEDDLVIFGGDFCFRYAPSESKTAPRKAFKHYRDQLKCKNIINICGNHDVRNGVKSPIQSMVIKHGGKRIFITHNPKFAKEEFDFNFCGHTHNKYGRFNKLGKNSCIVDLSVEGWNYEPVTINEIFGEHSKWMKSKKN